MMMMMMMMITIITAIHTSWTGRRSGFSRPTTFDNIDRHGAGVDDTNHLLESLQVAGCQFDKVG